MQAFEDTVSSSEAGYLLSWRELVNIASDLEQVYDCRIAAAKCPHSLSSQNAEWDSNPELLAVIKGLDSTEWSVRINDHLDDVEEVKERLASLA
ncbi:hypothetical protein ACGF0J_10910 [Nonomuraea sp. NPDC047897]|uniref:hypothetical protein n=1 Tax=Nonomuraea sp. NPDC047897 TaxID=3364346 RepID=UPI0037223658